MIGENGFDHGGELLITLGMDRKPSSRLSGEPFYVPTRVAFDKGTGEFCVAAVPQAIP